MIIIFSDGSGGSTVYAKKRGGWGAVIFCADKVPDDPGDFPKISKLIRLSGTEFGATNNQMELTAVIKALELVSHAKEKIIVYSDSTYIVNDIKFLKTTWKAKNFKGIKNPKLWKKMLDILESHPSSIEFRYVKAHSGIYYNEMADGLAGGEI